VKKTWQAHGEVRKLQISEENLASSWQSPQKVPKHQTSEEVRKHQISEI